jgi:D-3-phosphoglycerate dehydrogenase
MRKEGAAHKFFAYTENISRKKATDNADHVVASLDEFLTINQL